MQPEIKVTGLKELSQALRKLDPELAKASKARFKAIAVEVAGKVQARVPKRTGRAAASVRGGADQKSAYVKGGQKSVPYYGWLEFGGVLKPVGGRYNTITRERVAKGRYILPTVEENKANLRAAAEHAVHDAAKAAGFH